MMSLRQWYRRFCKITAREEQGGRKKGKERRKKGREEGKHNISFGETAREEVELVQMDTWKRTVCIATQPCNYTFVTWNPSWLVYLYQQMQQGFPHGSASEESACNAGDPGSIPG